MSECALTPAAAQGQVAASADPAARAEELRERLYQFALPLLQALDALIDVRLVRTFVDALEALIQFRNRAHGLLLSELGAFLLSPQHAPAGTKRLSNLLRCGKWSADLIARFLWQQALEVAGEPVLLLWDQSVLEKPESRQAEGLCPVRSTKAARLKRIRPGFYSPPPGPPVFVPGLHWVCLLLLGMSGAPVVAAMQWFATRGTDATDARGAAPSPRRVRPHLATTRAAYLRPWLRGSALVGRLLAGQYLLCAALAQALPTAFGAR